MKAFISKRAARAADRIDQQWRERADDPGVFAREFLEAIEQLETLAILFVLLVAFPNRLKQRKKSSESDCEPGCVAHRSHDTSTDIPIATCRVPRRDARAVP